MEKSLSNSSVDEIKSQSEINEENDSLHHSQAENLSNESMLLKQCDISENLSFDNESLKDNCLSNSHSPDNNLSFDQQLSQSTICQNIGDIKEELNSQKHSIAICDVETCTSSKDSILEPNIDNSTALSHNSREQNYCPESNKTLQYLHTEEIIKSLEAHNLNLEKEIVELKKSLQERENAFIRLESKIRNEFSANVEKLSKECHALRKDKEAMVVRYANSEKEVILVKKANQELEKKIKEVYKDRDTLSTKLKNVNIENNRLSSLNESKMIETAKLQKSFEKLNSDFNAREVRIKWLQNNLKTEMNSHQETQVKLNHTVQRLNEMKEEAEQVRRDCQDMIKCYQEDEEIKSVKLDSQLKQNLTELEVQKQEKSDQEQVYYLLRQELEALKKKQRLIMEENNSLIQKIHNLEKQRLEYEQNLSKLKDSQNTLKQEIVDLTARSAEMETLQLQLEREKEKSAASLREIERLRSTNAELQADMNACHLKEGELLKFTEGVTDTNVKLQSAYGLLEVKAQALEDELTETKDQLADLQVNYNQSLVEIEKIQKELEDESQLLAWKLAEKVKNVEMLNIKLDEAENENRVLKRRHIASVKELSRELYEQKRKLENFEITNGYSFGSRASSMASLDVISPNGRSSANELKQILPNII